MFSLGLGNILDKKELKSFQAFIFSVSRNIVIDHYRQSKKQTIDIDNIPEIIKTTLEPKHDPTFPVVVEIRNRKTVGIHKNKKF